MPREVSGVHQLAAALLGASTVALALGAQSTRPWQVGATGANAFGYPLPGLTAKERRAFVVGNAFFKENWVTAPASTTGRDGLGPLFNARSCSACHLRDGRGRPPTAEEFADDRIVPGLLFRTGLDHGEQPDLPHPQFGGQLQEHAILDYPGEGRVRTAWRTVTGTFDDGTRYELLAPQYSVEVDGEPIDDPKLTVGPRVAPQLIGLGLLEAVPAETILEWVDAQDADGDGVSGRAHWLGDPSARQPKPARQLGRFGWKATEPTVRSQVAGAFANDMGITSTLIPTEPVTATQRTRMHEDLSRETPDLTDHKLDRVAFYCQTLAVPTQRTPDAPHVVRGRAVFDSIGCSGCHRPSMTTGEHTRSPALATATFSAFTDLLLHDLGEGLSDGKHDGDAHPGEWRTPPLWGIGLFEDVNGHTRYLHDGRARNLEEAVLWHGGEAAGAQRAYRALTGKDRDALIAFLQSL